MSESAEVISERYNLNALETMPALKSAVVECIKEEDALQAEEIAQQVFRGHTLAQQDFVHRAGNRPHKRYGRLRKTKPATETCRFLRNSRRRRTSTSRAT